MIMYDYVTYVVCNFVSYYHACYYMSVITDWFDIWINILIESSLLAYEMCQVILLMLCSIVWYVYRFLNTVLMGFDHYRCVLDRIFSFSKLPEYWRRFHFRKYRTVFVSDEKMWKRKWWSPGASLGPCGLCNRTGPPNLKGPKSMEYI